MGSECGFMIQPELSGFSVLSVSLNLQSPLETENRTLLNIFVIALLTFVLLSSISCVISVFSKLIFLVMEMVFANVC